MVCARMCVCICGCVYVGMCVCASESEQQNSSCAFLKILWKKVDCSYFSTDGSSERTFCDFCHNLSVIVCVSL